MSTTNTLDRVTFSANGSAREFSCAPLQVVDARDITVYTAGGVVYEEAYRVIGPRDTFGPHKSASTFSLAFDTPPPAGIYTVVRDTAFEQEAEFEDKRIESAIDRVALRGLDTALHGSSRGLRSGVLEDPLNTLPPVARRAGQLLGFDLAGQPVAVDNSNLRDTTENHIFDVLWTGTQAATAHLGTGGADIATHTPAYASTDPHIQVVDSLARLNAYSSLLLGFRAQLGAAVFWHWITLSPTNPTGEWALDSENINWSSDFDGRSGAEISFSADVAGYLARYSGETVISLSFDWAGTDVNVELRRIFGLKKNIRSLVPDDSDLPHATQAARGILRLANAEDTADGTNEVDALTPARLREQVGARVSQLERKSINVTGVRRFSPEDIRFMVRYFSRPTNPFHLHDDVTVRLDRSAIASFDRVLLADVSAFGHPNRYVTVQDLQDRFTAAIADRDGTATNIHADFGAQLRSLADDDRFIVSDESDEDDPTKYITAQDVLAYIRQRAPFRVHDINEQIRGVDLASDDRFAVSDESAVGQPNKFITLAGLREAIGEASNPVVVTLDNSGQNVAWPLDIRNQYVLTLVGNKTLLNPTGAVNGGIYILNVVQDPTGGREITWGDEYDFGPPGQPQLSSDPNRIDILTFFFTQGKMRLMSVSGGFQ